MEISVSAFKHIISIRIMFFEFEKLSQLYLDAQERFVEAGGVLKEKEELGLIPPFVTLDREQLESMNGRPIRVAQPKPRRKKRN